MVNLWYTIIGWGLFVLLIILVAVKSIIAAQSAPKKCDEREVEELTREQAKINSENEKKCKQEQAKRIMWMCWLALISLVTLIDMIIAAVVATIIVTATSQKIMVFTAFFVTFAVCITISAAILFFVSRRDVDQNWEWVIEFFGKWFTTWDSGLHFLFPFFMSIKAQVFKGDQMITLYMDEKERDGEVDAMIEFFDTSSAVIIRLIFYLFSSDRAVYNIDDVVRAIREKMDAGLRAYFGKKKLDEAIAERAEMDLEAIIKQSATDPKIFKYWGAEIRSIAVVDITLPETVKKQRDKIIEAEKDREAAVIEIKTAESKAEVERIKQEVRGMATGQEIKKVMEQTGPNGLNAQQAAEYLLNKKYFEAITPNKGVIIAGKGTGAPMMGAQLAASLSLTSERLGEKSGAGKDTTEKPDATEKPKEKDGGKK